MGIKIFKDKIWQHFTINISLVMVLFVMGIFIGLMYRNNQLIYRVVLEQARAHFRSIVKTREWNADFGGVYVEKKGGVKSNPYLKNPDITSTDGRVFTLRNPAIMTREISENFKKSSTFSFHITSLKPVNPNNIADAFEKESLLQFEKGKNEAYRDEAVGGKTYFRYIAPLYMEKNCFSCHAEMGYADGDVRGGISITVDITDVQNTLSINRLIIIILAVLTALILLSIFYLSVIKLMRNLDAANKKINQMAITDDLTSLYNRRYFFSKLDEEIQRGFRHRHPVSCIMIDVDYFKTINDSHGHLAGDAVLREISAIIKINCRVSDTPARFGGEEIIIILPETDMAGSLNVANKIRELVDKNVFITAEKIEIKTTISLGVSSMIPDKIDGARNSAELVKNADIALYLAKNRGRNRVESV